MKLNFIAGLPRAGSTLLCNILNMNPDFSATATSPLMEMLIGQESFFSHNPSVKAIDRMAIYDNFKEAQRSFIEGFYKDKNFVFDKNRGWVTHLRMIDEILGNKDSKIIWTYRDPVNIVGSIEKNHRAFPLMQFTEEAQAPNSFNTLSSRVDNLISDGGIVAHPGWMLNSAIEEGYENRIFIVSYKDLCENPQDTMNDIHEFLQIDKFQYDSNNFTDLKQTTAEYDTFYNHKYSHSITEGKIEFVENTYQLPDKYKKIINERFSWVNDYCRGKINERVILKSKAALAFKK